MSITDINNAIALLRKMKNKVIITGGFSRYLLNMQESYDRNEIDIILKDIEDLKCIDHLLTNKVKSQDAIWHGNLMQRYACLTKIYTKIKHKCLNTNKKWYLDVFVGENAGETILVDGLLCAVINEKNK